MNRSTFSPFSGRSERRFFAYPTLVVLALSLMLGIVISGASTREFADAAGIPSGAVVAREVIVAYEDGALHTSAAGDAIGARTVARAPSLAAELLELPPDVSIEDAIAELSDRPDVAYVEPNVRLRASGTPNDPWFGNQSWYMELIGATSAWDRQVGSPEVVVAVIDTGVDLDHEDLAARLWVNAAETPNDGIDNDGNGCIDDVNGCNFVASASNNNCGYTTAVPNALVEDDAGHGTQVAGVLGAAGSNGTGLAGMAWNVRLMVVKGMDCAEGGTAFDVAGAVDYAAANGARIINLSLGGPNDSTMLTEAIDRATAKGVLVVAAGGNANTSLVDYPARLPNVLGVGASGGQVSGSSAAPFTSWGPGIDVAAPGVDIVTSRRGNVYGTTSGTSFSTPLVSGLAALVLSQNPSLSGSEARTLISATAEDLPDGDRPGWDGAGQIRANVALEHVPSTFTGSIAVDGLPAAVGTPIDAFVGDTLCGSSSVVARFDGTSGYELRVPSAAAAPGCGALGTVVRFVVGGVEASTHPAWLGALQGVDIEVDVSALQLRSGWNLIGFASTPPSLDPATVLAPILPVLETAIAFNAETQQFEFFLPDEPAISTLGSLRPDGGLWLLLDDAALLPHSGAPRPAGEPIDLVEGLNLVSPALASPIPIEDALSGIDGAYLAVFGFTGGPSGSFLTYVPEGPDALRTLPALEPGKGYWFVMAAPATLATSAAPLPD